MEDPLLFNLLREQHYVLEVCEILLEYKQVLQLH
jgi:hypothetical protein